MAATRDDVFFMFKSKRTRIEAEEDDFYQMFMKRNSRNSNENSQQIKAGITATVAVLENVKQRKDRAPDKQRNVEKLWWLEVYQKYSDEDFKSEMRLNRDTFNYILNEIHDQIVLTPTNLKPNPTPPHRQLGLTIYRLATGCSCNTLAALFGLSIPCVNEFFNKICRILVRKLYNQYVRLPETEAEWGAEVKGFLENYEFPCVGAWGGFHVYVNSNPKNYFSFKKRYSMTNLGLVGFNKRFLYAAVGAPGSTHDARLLKESSIYTAILNGDVMPDKVIRLSDFGEIPLVTIGDSAFPQYAWLLKMYNENTRDKQQKYFNKRLCGARVVTENAYGMLKGRWRFLYKKTECRLFNLRYIIMACIALHNICIDRSDPCQPRWRLEVEQLDLIEKPLSRAEDKEESSLNRMKISNWLWMDH